MDDADPKSWIRWAERVLKAIEDHEKRLDIHDKRINRIEPDIRELQVKVGLISAAVGFLAGIAPNLIQFIISRM